MGGRLFPGVHHRADFEVRETGEYFRVALRSHDDSTRVAVEGTMTDAMPASSMFATLENASEFFERGAIGYSATRRPGHYDGLELRTFDWHVEPLRVTAVQSTYFEDVERFPPGSATFDCALLMRNIAHEWHAQDEVCQSCVAPAA